MITKIILAGMFFLGFLLFIFFLSAVFMDPPDLDVIQCDGCGGLFPREDLNGDELIRRTDEGDFCNGCRS